VRRWLAGLAVVALAITLWLVFSDPSEQPRGSNVNINDVGSSDVGTKSSVTKRSTVPSGDGSQRGAVGVPPNESFVAPSGLPDSVKQHVCQVLSQQIEYFDKKANRPAGPDESIGDYLGRISAMCESRKRRLVVGVITGEAEGALYLASMELAPKSLISNGAWLAFGVPWKVSPGDISGHWKLDPDNGDDRRLVVEIEMDKELEALRETYLNAELAWVGEVCAEVNALPVQDRELEIDKRGLRADARFLVGGGGLVYPAESR